MPRKKKNNKPAAIAKKQRGKSSRAKSRSSRNPSAEKAFAKKQKAEPQGVPVLNAEKLKELYATMVKCRMLAERMHSGRTAIDSVHGFEATLVGAGAHLLSHDCIALEQGSFFASLVQGTPARSLLARNNARQSNGTDNAIASKQHDNDTAALTIEAVLKLAANMKGKNAAVLMFCAHDAETLRFDSAAMAMAATQKLPVVCLVESRLDSPLELPNQVASGPYIGADPTFYPRIPVDGCDVVGVFRVAQEAIRRAREGHGPAVIECLTARSSTAKNSERASSQYLAQDPLSFMEEYLRRRSLWSDEWPQSIIQEFGQQLSEAKASLKNPGDSENQLDNEYSADPAAALAQ